MGQDGFICIFIKKLKLNCGYVSLWNLHYDSGCTFVLLEWIIFYFHKGI